MIWDLHATKIVMTKYGASIVDSHLTVLAEGLAQYMQDHQKRFKEGAPRYILAYLIKKYGYLSLLESKSEILTSTRRYDKVVAMLPEERRIVVKAVYEAERKKKLKKNREKITSKEGNLVH